jgi:hypothetical protein
MLNDIISALALAALVLFCACAVVAAGGWFYSVRYSLPLTFRYVRDESRRSDYKRRVWAGRLVSIVAWAVAWVAGLLAESGGGW